MDTRKHSRCTSKIRHYSRGKAEAALRSLKRLNPDELLEVYICPYSGKRTHYHVGHQAAANPNNKYKTGARRAQAQKSK